MRWLIVALAVLVIIMTMTPRKTKDNNSAARMKKLRAIKAKKAEERNRAQMKKVA